MNPEPVRPSLSPLEELVFFLGCPEPAELGPDVDPEDASRHRARLGPRQPGPRAAWVQHARSPPEGRGAQDAYWPVRSPKRPQRGSQRAAKGRSGAYRHLRVGLDPDFDHEGGLLALFVAVRALGPELPDPRLRVAVAVDVIVVEVRAELPLALGTHQLFRGVQHPAQVGLASHIKRWGSSTPSPGLPSADRGRSHCCQQGCHRTIAPPS